MIIDKKVRRLYTTARSCCLPIRSAVERISVRVLPSRKTTLSLLPSLFPESGNFFRVAPAEIRGPNIFLYSSTRLWSGMDSR